MDNFYIPLHVSVDQVFILLILLLILLIFILGFVVLKILTIF